MDLALALTIVTSILLITFVTAPVISLIADRRLFKGYRDLRSELRYIAEVLKGSISRRENDLLVSALHSGGFPVEARFSNDEYRPALIVRLMTPPLPFGFSVRPKRNAGSLEWGPVSVNNTYLSARFAIVADNPGIAALFLDDETAAEDLLQLCWSGSNHFSMTAQQVELLEPTLPNSAEGVHCLNQIRAMARLVARAEEMPGARSGQAQRVKKNRHLMVRTAGAIAAVVTIAALWSVGIAPTSTLPAPARASGKPVQSVPAQDASRIRGLVGWRMADVGDFGAPAVQWLQQQARNPSGRLQADFSGTARGGDVAYILRRDDGAFRLVMLVDNRIACDVNYRHIEGAAVIRRDQLASASWVDGRTRTPDGDGILVILDPNDTTSALVLFEESRALVSARPADYRNLILG